MTGPVLAVLCLSTLLCLANPVASAEQHLRFKRGQTSLWVRGQLTQHRPALYYTIYARAGQYMRVEIVPLTADLHTEGSVKFPHSPLEPGNPGGVVFDEQLPTDGMYRIRVGQRFNETKAGRFMLKLWLR